MKRKFLQVLGGKIAVQKQAQEDYICLTDMVRNIENGASLIEKWLRNKNTIEFLGIWETLHNPDFNSPEFEGIKNDAGLNRFAISAKQWVQRTNARGIIAQAGRYGGTYAHKDIAFEFGSWISPKFKLYLITEYQRAKEAECNPKLQQWDVKRILSKTNYVIGTDAIKQYIVPKKFLGKLRQDWTYATEADMLNLVVFGFTARAWCEANPELARKRLNVRDVATINQLVVLSNMESYNAELIRQGVSREVRRVLVHRAAKTQLAALDKHNAADKFRKLEGNEPRKLLE